MMKKILLMGIIALISALTIAACGNDNEGSNPHEGMDMDPGSEESMDMDHSGSADVPEGLIVQENPTYAVGTKAILETDHMEGMKGAEATIVGAYDTTAYAISYTPTTGGERVTNHKWVIHDEIKDAGEDTLELGTEVTIEADHMNGMDGATAEIDFAEQTTVYMVDYTSTTNGEEVTNHKWVTESELSPK
ncbi:YdhK family protein [Paenisporosarcina sp. TG20]|uniref:YdhK family protein n=1 Tax=Paenisporosarcina sp. TG20 TaxID=1211706 RepID=UPI0002F3DD19|nr:YdhK family protein [Paenisporosarcina sp. TG20]